MNENKRNRIVLLADRRTNCPLALSENFYSNRFPCSSWIRAQLVIGRRITITPAIFDATAEAHACTTSTRVLMRPHARRIAAGAPDLRVPARVRALISAVGALYAYNMLNVT